MTQLTNQQKEDEEMMEVPDEKLCNIDYLLEDEENGKISQKKTFKAEGFKNCRTVNESESEEEDYQEVNQQRPNNRKVLHNGY